MPASSQFVAYLQRVTGTFLTDSALIEKESQSVGQYGEPLHAWQVTDASAVCRLIQGAKATTTPDFVSGAQETMPDLYTLVVEADTELDVNYRVTVNEIVYQVVRLEAELTDKGFRTALVSRQRGAV